MNKKTKFHIQCNLKLSLSPVSVDDLSYLFDDPEFHRVVKNSSLYMICQRPCLLFRNLEINQSNIKGEIFQTVTNNVIKFNLPFFQKNVIEGNKREFKISFVQNHGFKSRIATKEKFELKEADNIESILLQEKNGKFIKYISPDTILERVWAKKWNCKILGKIKYESTFNLHYIGESVIQPIWKRLKNHSKLQHILSRENSYYQGINLSSELVVLIFRISATYDTRLIKKMKRDELANYLTKSDQINNDTIYYDVEKAFIKSLQPKYNIRRYNNYPESINGVKKEDFSFLSYMIDEPITLIHNEEKFECGTLGKKVNSIFVDFDNSKTNIEEHSH